MTNNFGVGMLLFLPGFFTAMWGSGSVSCMGDGIGLFVVLFVLVVYCL
jgi:hypothetical protein